MKTKETGKKTLHTERVYVKVNSTFDYIGYCMPKSIFWPDGREFRIDEVKDYRPASMLLDGKNGDCYTVVVRGEERFLYFERFCDADSARIGRWYVECSKKTAGTQNNLRRSHHIF
ncbi:MAG: hypothetical protein Q4C42_10810 [Clostridia bacterium]|nr:hypothetical protein [Clostridia bacterium]